MVVGLTESSGGVSRRSATTQHNHCVNLLERVRVTKVQELTVAICIPLFIGGRTLANKLCMCVCVCVWGGEGGFATQPNQTSLIPACLAYVGKDKFT